MLTEIFEGRNRGHSVTASVDKGAVRIGSSKPGYLYVLAAGSDVAVLFVAVLFPNATETNNQIRPGQMLRLPDSKWPTNAQFLAIVSDEPRDFGAVGPMAGTVNCASARPCSESYGAVIFSGSVVSAEPVPRDTARGPAAPRTPAARPTNAVARRCSDILERASLGEVLTAEEYTSSKGLPMMIRKLSAYAAVLLIVAGCAEKTAPPPPPPPPPPVASSDTSERSFDEAVSVATDGLVAQLQKGPKRGVVIDPMVDASSGQQTGATRLLEQRVGERLQNPDSPLDVMPFEVANLSTAVYLLTGTMTRTASGQSGPRQVFQIDLALTDLKTGKVVAQASSRARDEGLDVTPTPYYRDSPIVVKDKVVDGYITTSKTPPGQAADPVYFERVATATVVSEATLAYNNQSYQDSLSLYQSAVVKPGGEQLKVLNGIYLASWKLGRASEAEDAFGKVVALGLSNNNLGVKFLFNPGTTNFWSDPQVSGPQPLAAANRAAGGGDEGLHERRGAHEPDRSAGVQRPPLLQRAAYIKRRLDAEAPEPAKRTRSSGMGSASPS